MPQIVFKRWIKNNPLVFISTFFIILLLVFVLTYRLTSIHQGPNAYEITTLSKLSSLSDLIKDPADFLYILVAKLISLLTTDLNAIRLTSIFFAVLTIINIRFIIKYWYDSRTANIGMIITTISFWFIIISRTGGPLIMPAFWLSLTLSIFSWLKYTTRQKIALSLLLIATSIAIYTPLFLWWILSILLVITTKYGIKYLYKKLHTPFSLIPLLLLLPLIVVSITDVEVLKKMLGVSTQITGVADYLRNVSGYFSQLVIRGSINPIISLGRLPYLDIFSIVMLAIGCVTLYPERNNLKGIALLKTPLFYIGAISLFSVDKAKLVLLLPIIFIIITIGLKEFIDFWLKGFPRNPFGRLAGLIIVAVLISASGYYNIRSYYVAWTQNPDAKAAHNQSYK